MSNESQKNLFRKKALDRLSSPERLDQVITIIKPRDWLPLSGIGVLTLLGLVWCIFGSIPITISGKGILIFPKEVVRLQSPLGGQLKELNIKPGSQIKKDNQDQINDSQEIIAIIEPLELKNQQRLQEVKLQQLKQEAQQSEILELQQLELAKISFNQQRESIEQKIRDFQGISPRLQQQSQAVIQEQKKYLQQQIKDSQNLIPVLKERVERRQAIYQEGAISKDQVLNAEQEYRANLQKIGELKAALKKLELEAIEKEQQSLNLLSQISELKAKLAEINREEKSLTEKYFKSKIERNQQILAVSQEIERLKQQIKLNSIIKSPYNGTLIELAIAEGQIVSPGTYLGLVQTNQSQTQELISVAYFSVADGKKIKPGMTMQVTPTSVKRERFGGILATVKSVSTFPISKESVTHLTGNAALAESLLKDPSQPQIEVWATLKPNLNNFTGYDWSSSQGPEDLKISQGTTTSVRLTVENRRPVTFILPFLREIINN